MQFFKIIVFSIISIIEFELSKPAEPIGQTNLYYSFCRSFSDRILYEQEAGILYGIVNFHCASIN